MKPVLLWLIRWYQLALSPLLGPRCRYFPSCSGYAQQAIVQYGAWQGSLLALRRLLRCHPWGGSGYDPVPLLFGRLKFFPCTRPAWRLPYRQPIRSC